MEARAWLSRHRDPLLAALSAIGLVAELVVWPDADLPRAIPLAGVAAGALLWRRTQPVPSFLATWLALMAITQVAPGFDNGSSTFVLIFFVSLFSLGAHTRGLEVGVAVVLVMVGIVVFVYTDSDSFAVGDVVFGIFFVGGPWATGLAVRLRGDLARTNEQLRREQEERAARAVAEERSRIARELHDVVSHAIAVTVLQARGARRTLDTDPAAAREALDAIEQTNTAALGDMRRLLAVLRDTEPDGRIDDEHAPQPSLAHLDGLVDHVRSSGAEVEVEVVGTPRDMPPGVDLSAYRIVQEALTNVLKHAEAAPTRVCLEYADDALTVTVVDRGSATSVAADGRGHGLIGIRERVAVVGGDVDAGPVESGGYRVRARLPYALEET